MQLSHTRIQSLSYSLTLYWQEFVQPVLPPFLISRSLVLITGFLLQWLLDTGRIIKYGFIGDAPLATLSATFDANWYGMIATSGYSTSADVMQPQNYHFFPLYPLLMRLLGDLTGLGTIQGGYYLAGVILSHLFFLPALVVLYKLTLQVWQSPIWARRTIWIMCAMPWANVFSMTYAESLILLLTVGAILIAYNNRRQPNMMSVGSASLLAMLATLTRPQGFIVAMTVAWLVSITPPALAVSRRLILALLSLLPSLAAGAGFVLYIAMHTQSGNILAIQQTTSAWGVSWLADLPRIFILPPSNPMWLLDIQATLTLTLWVILTVGLLVQIFKFHKERSSMFEGSTMIPRSSIALAIFAAGTFMVTLLGNPMNIGWGRYMLYVFPLAWLLTSYLPNELQFNRVMKYALVGQVLFMYCVVTQQFTP